MFGSFLVFVRVLRLMMSHGFPNIANATHTAYFNDLSGMISGIVRYVVLQKLFPFSLFFLLANISHLATILGIVSREYLKSLKMVLLGTLVNRFYLHFISTCLRIYAFVYLEILSNYSPI